MCRPLIGLLLLLGLDYSAALHAHTRSESFSRWQFSGQTLSLRFTVNAREATRIPRSPDSKPLEWVLANYLNSHIVAGVPDSDCKLSQAPHPLTSRSGFLQIEAVWQCSKPPRFLEIHAFFDLAAEHTHFASYSSPDGLSQRLMTADNQVWQLAVVDAANEEVHPSVSTFMDYVYYGFQHISSGLDHIVFLLALLLICRQTREIIWAITGFTLGHSITLSLAVLGMVQPHVPAIEATIGLTIALVAIERAACSLKSAVPLAVVCAVLLFLMVPLASSHGGSIGTTALSGLALFSFCYLLIAHELGGRGSYRIFITALFGLVHGFGFAGAFLSAHTATDSLLMPLAGFNIGVELGQLALVTVLLSLGMVIQRKMRFAPVAADLVAAVVCGFGVFWFVERSFV